MEIGTESKKKNLSFIDNILHAWKLLPAQHLKK